MNDNKTSSAAVCTLGLERKKLSAWRDRALSDADTRLLDAHVGQCEACLARLAEYEALAQALRGDRPPHPDERLWAGVSGAFTRMSAVEQRSLLQPNQSRRHALEWLSAVAAVVLITVGFVQIFAQHSTHPTSRLTATPTPFIRATPTLSPARQIVWQQQTLPVSIGSSRQNVLSVSDGDGNTAYICEMPSNESSTLIHIWATHDRGAHWKSMTNIRLDEQPDICHIVIDQTDPQIVALWMTSQISTGQFNTNMRVTFDGGASWQARAWRSDLPLQLISWRNLAFATFAEKPVSINFGGLYPSPHMMVSADGMHTWTRIEEGLTSIDGVEQQIHHFWLNPISGELLAESGAPVIGIILPGDKRLTPHLWRSNDAGQHWTRLNDAPPSNDITDYLVQQSIGTVPWQICADAVPLVCSSDGGQTWRQRTQHGRTVSVISFAPDGSLLGVGPAEVVDKGTGSQNAQAGSTLDELFRLPPNADVWQSLGVLPAPYPDMPGDMPDFIVGAQSSIGVLWVWGVRSSSNKAYTATYP